MLDIVEVLVFLVLGNYHAVKDLHSSASKQVMVADAEIDDMADKRAQRGLVALQTR